MKKTWILFDIIITGLNSVIQIDAVNKIKTQRRWFILSLRSDDVRVPGVPAAFLLDIVLFPRLFLPVNTCSVCVCYIRESLRNTDICWVLSGCWWWTTASLLQLPRLCLLKVVWFVYFTVTMSLWQMLFYQFNSTKCIIQLEKKVMGLKWNYDLHVSDWTFNVLRMLRSTYRASWVQLRLCTRDHLYICHLTNNVCKKYALFLITCNLWMPLMRWFNFLSVSKLTRL